MDTSEIYIKQCDCPEIQDNFQNKNGDYIVLEGVPKIIGGKELDKNWIRHSSAIWLPRQDQLQEMVNINENNNPVILNEKFNDFIWSKKIGEISENDKWWSMEQLWLSFVMKEKFNKTWNSEKEEWEE